MFVSGGEVVEFMFMFIPVPMFDCKNGLLELPCDCWDMEPGGDIDAAIWARDVPVGCGDMAGFCACGNGFEGLLIPVGRLALLLPVGKENWFDGYIEPPPTPGDKDPKDA